MPYIGIHKEISRIKLIQAYKIIMYLLRQFSIDITKQNAVIVPLHPLEDNRPTLKNYSPS